MRSSGARAAAPSEPTHKSTSGSTSGGAGYTISPATPSGSRLVAKHYRWGQALGQPVRLFKKLDESVVEEEKAAEGLRGE